jgi:hypothetical protein
MMRRTLMSGAAICFAADEAAATGAETVEEAAKGAEAPADDAAPAETAEAKATRMGWRPQSEFKGEPSKWIDAETFVKRGEEILPIVQANAKALEKANQAAEKRIANLEKTLKEFGDYHTKSEERAYQRALADLVAQQEAFAEAGNVEGVRATTEQIVDLGKEVSKVPKVTADDAEPQHITDFRAENPWFQKDSVMTAAAHAIAEELALAGLVDPVKQLAEVSKRIKTEFPHKFENQRRAAPATVESSTPTRKAGKTYSDLPPDAKAQCDRFVTQIKGFSRDNYVKDFFAQ